MARPTKWVSESEVASATGKIITASQLSEVAVLERFITEIKELADRIINTDIYSTNNGEKLKGQLSGVLADDNFTHLSLYSENIRSIEVCATKRKDSEIEKNVS